MINLNQIKEAINNIGMSVKDKELSKLSQEEMLEKLYVFGEKRVSFILQIATKEELEDIINKSAEIILEPSTKALRNELPGYEYNEKIIKKVSKEFPAVFKKVEYEVSQSDIYDNFINELNTIEGKAKNIISALLSTVEEANKLKNQIQTDLDKFKEISLNKKLLEKQLLIDNFNQDVNVTRDKLFKLVDTKLLESPTKVYYCKSGSRVVCKVKMNKSGYTYQRGRGKEVRINKNIDTKEYPLSVSVSYLEDFLYTNKVEDKDILLDERSVDTFYAFDNEISINLTPAFVKSWWNYDCPDLYKCSTNKGQKYTNMLGTPLPHFSDKLVESSFSKDYISEDITEDEISLLTKGKENTRMYKEMMNMLEALKLKKDEEKTEKLTNEVKEFDKKVQASIDNNKEEIIDYLKKKFEVVSEKPFRINDNFGLDCGFLYILTSDKQYTEKRSILSNISSSISHYMDVNMPYFSQSLTVMKEQFNKVREIVKRNLNIELYSETYLD